MTTEVTAPDTSDDDQAEVAPDQGEPVEPAAPAEAPAPAPEPEAPTEAPAEAEAHDCAAVTASVHSATGPGQLAPCPHCGHMMEWVARWFHHDKVPSSGVPA